MRIRSDGLTRSGTGMRSVMEFAIESQILLITPTRTRSDDRYPARLQEEYHARTFTTILARSTPRPGDARRTAPRPS